MRWNVHKSVDETIKWLTDVETNISNKNAYDWAFILKENNEIFGTGGVYYNEDYKMFEIGYNLMKKYWGLGLATEASRAMLKFSVDELNERNFYARYVKENTVSGRVLEKLGFVYKQDGEYSAFDGRVFESREYFLSV
jgi:ribosomal-protein-alanine N-acetyltransferase